MDGEWVSYNILYGCNSIVYDMMDFSIGMTLIFIAEIRGRTNRRLMIMLELMMMNGWLSGICEEDDR